MLYYHGSFITDAKTAKANGIGPVALVVVSGAFVVSGALAGLSPAFVAFAAIVVAAVVVMVV